VNSRDAEQSTEPVKLASPAPSHPPASQVALTLAALGVVFGDIGTSPLYTLRECMRAAGGARATTADVLGILSLIFWSMTMIVSVKYLAFVMRANNRGEGGIFALLAIAPEHLRRRAHRAPGKRRFLGGVAALVVVGAALLYGDGAITPAISVLSAIEGLAIARPELEHTVVPITCAILIALFSLQRYGTGAVGKLFAPVMVLWFATIGGLGIHQIAERPGVLAALSPLHAVSFFATHGWAGLHVLGSVVLAVTGGEALFADMGHFGPRPIRRAWLFVAKPALVACYFGQGALLLREPHVSNPFFGMAPSGGATLALVLLSSAATVIASQAMISGAFSLTRQAMQLGFFPRVAVKHTAHHTEGQIYIPEINWFLAIACILLVIGFKRSEHLAAAYGIAVTGTMVITSIVYFVVTRLAWKWSLARALPILLLFLSLDLPFFIANLSKIAAGGWVPLLIGSIMVTAMLIWSHGRTLVVEQYTQRYPDFDAAMGIVRAKLQRRVPGTAAFMSSVATHMPPLLVHFVERIGVLPETVILLTVVTESVPEVHAAERWQVTPLGEGFMRVVVRYGFMEQPNVPVAVAAGCAAVGANVQSDQITYFLGRQNLLAGKGGRMGRVEETLFSFLQRNAVTADSYFQIPPQQVIEIGIQMDL
jgi:KUP system potassium uptake protein